jgi:hypothetical protein
MPWLLRDGEVLASLEIAGGQRQHASGLTRREGIEGALLLPAGRTVHTFGVSFPIDVAFCDLDIDLDDDVGGLVVVRTVTMRQWRISLPSLHARVAVEAEAGAFARWELRPGDALEVKQ